MFTFRKTVIQLDPTVQSRKIIRGHTGCGVLKWQCKEDFANTSSNTKACMYCIVLQVLRGRNVITDSARQKATTGKCYSGKRINTYSEMGVIYIFSLCCQFYLFTALCFFSFLVSGRRGRSRYRFQKERKNNKALLATQHFSFDRRRIN